MQQPDLQDGIAALDQNERRTLRFEARKFALESLTKIYLAQLDASRNLRVGHVKLTFALSVGTLAGFLTLISAFARFIDDFPTWPTDMTGLSILAFGMSCLVVAAAVAITQYRATVERSADMLLRPYPDAEADVHAILSGQPANEMEYLDRLSAILRARTQDKRQYQPPSSMVLVLITIGAVATTVALFIL